MLRVIVPDDVPFSDADDDTCPNVLIVPFVVEGPEYGPLKIGPAYCCWTAVSPTFRTGTPSMLLVASP